MQKCLDQMNVRAHHAVSDAQGVTGMLILRAIVAGERDPRKLAGFREEGCHKSREQTNIRPGACALWRPPQPNSATNSSRKRRLYLLEEKGVSDVPV